MMSEAKPKVYNKRQKGVPKDAVYVGRPTKWGNQFTHLSSKLPDAILVPSRAVALLKYCEWLAEEAQKDFVQQIQTELRGKDLVCWCAPSPCHADILLVVANSE